MGAAVGVLIFVVLGLPTSGGPSGLSASVWSSDPAAALAVGERLQAGTVWINEVMHLSPLVPFGGLKQSGVGVESGVTGLLEFTQPQTIMVRR